MGHGSHKKRIWFHAKGRTGIRKKYFSHLWVRAWRCSCVSLKALLAECWLHQLS